MRRSFLLLLLFGLLIATAAGKPFLAEVQDTLVTLGNDAIRLVVNNSQDGRGRFAVDVTGGDPKRMEDDAQPLIYGRPVPWTSFTTIRLNGLLFAFGGSTTKRAAAGLATGQMLTPPHIREGAIITAWRYGDVEVTQHLSIVEGPTTGLADTARIVYTFINRGEVAHRIGLRVCLDTMLGSNDGAPFRIGSEQITTDRILHRETIQPYWQAFDSLDEPRVIAQGSLIGGELTPPEAIIFSNWGSLADEPWIPPLIADRDFTRTGEFELDSAVALIWDETVLEPGAVLNRVTYYGLGDVTIARGDLTLGVTAPATVNSGRGNTFLVLGYLENRGSGVAQDVSLELKLPGSLRPVTPVTAGWDRLRPGESRQVAWIVEAVGSGTALLKVEASAFGLEPTVVERTIRLVAPPRLSLVALDPPLVKTSAGRYEPYPVTVQAIVTNEGGHAASNTWVQLVPGPGSMLAPGENGYRFIGSLQPGEDVLVRWSIISNGITGVFPYRIQTGSLECPPLEKSNTIRWPELPKRLRVVVNPVESSPGWFRADLLLLNVPECAGLLIQLKTSPEAGLIAVQRGGFMVEAGRVLPWSSEPRLEQGFITVDIRRSTPHGQSEATVATLWFRTAHGSLPVGVETIRILDAAGHPVPVIVLYDQRAGK